LLGDECVDDGGAFWMGYEVDFLPVGESNGDAICIRYGTEQTGYTIHIVDGGYTDTGQLIVDHIKTYYGNPSYIDHVVLTHADQDHAAGLRTVLQSFKVGNLWMNRPWLYCDEIVGSFHGLYTVEGLRKKIRSEYSILVELEELAAKNGTIVNEVFAGHQIGAVRVLAPLRDTYLKLIPELDRTPESYAEGERSALVRAFDTLAKAVKRFFETWTDEKLEENPDPVSASNESSVIQLGKVDQWSFVLTGDGGPKALMEAAHVANYYSLLSPPDLFQIPHHGSRRNVTPSVLNAWLGMPLAKGSPRRGGAYCCVGTNKPEYPRKRVQNAFTRRGYEVSTTKGGTIRWQRNMPVRAGWQAVAVEHFVESYEE
jgi:beta-lactamase superfamily II metal-dependent hydrolase